MTILNLLFIVFLGILFFVSYFHISNLALDAYGGKSVRRYNFENSIRVIIFIAPAFIVLFIFILVYYKLINLISSHFLQEC